MGADSSKARRTFASTPKPARASPASCVPHSPVAIKSQFWNTLHRSAEEEFITARSQRGMVEPTVSPTVGLIQNAGSRQEWESAGAEREVNT